MLLGARPLVDVQNVNSYHLAEVLEFTAGDTQTVFFQLIDSSLDRQGFTPPGRRYIPAAGASLECIVESVDDRRQITRQATNPFADDRSIWQLSFLSTDKIRGTANIRLRLTESGSVRHGLMKNVLRIQNQECL